MPHSDNLYSADGSDAESFSDELSPTDGYFTNRAHPQDVMVPDPTTESSNAKAQEARAEAQASSENHFSNSQVRPASPTSSLLVSTGNHASTYAPTSPTTYTPSTPTSSFPRQEGSYSEASPLLHSSAPPPAYSAATSQSGDQYISRNYSTVSARQLEEGRREPESMGQPNEYDERTPLWGRKTRKIPGWLSLRRSLLIILVLGLLIGFITIAAKSGKSKHGEDLPPGKPPSSEPGVEHRSYCNYANTHYPDQLPTYEFMSGDALAVLQVTENTHRGSASVSTAGEIILRRLPEDREDQLTGYITFDLWLSDPNLRYDVEMDAEMQALKVTTPGSTNLSPNEHHCISLEITIWVPPSASFKELTIQSTELSLRVLDDVELYVSEISKFGSYSGSLYFPGKNGSAFQETHETSKTSLDSNENKRLLGDIEGFSSREIYVGTSSGSVTGTFPLWDLLLIDSNSGSFDICITPKPVLEDDPKPAQLTLSTVSGNINSRLPLWQESSIPVRDYRTRINTHSGNIQADIIIGTSAVIKSVSGSLAITALPTTYENSFFTTGTESGGTDITVLSPLSGRARYAFPPEDFTDIGDDDPYRIGHPESSPDVPAAPLSGYKRPLSRLVSQHEGGSGQVKMQYPSVWVGEINAETISGNIKVGGDGVRIIKDSRKNWAYHEVVARKGVGAERASSLRVQQVSGGIDIWVGEK